MHRYSTPFALSLARSINALFSPSSPPPRIAFLSSPTAYVALQSLPNPSTRTLLFEYDERFDVLPVAGPRRRTLIGGGASDIGKNEGGFVKYDLYEPESFPKELRGTVGTYCVTPLSPVACTFARQTPTILTWPDPCRYVDLAVIDPPYLNEVSYPHLYTLIWIPRAKAKLPLRPFSFLSFPSQKTNALVAQTLSLLLNPTSAKLLILTSTSVPFEVLKRVYDLPMLGPIRRCEGAEVEHDGGRIQNPFGMYASWEGGEKFMDPPAADDQWSNLHRTFADESIISLSAFDFRLRKKPYPFVHAEDWKGVSYIRTERKEVKEAKGKRSIHAKRFTASVSGIEAS
jgi:hypothetical protein